MDKVRKSLTTADCLATVFGDSRRAPSVTHGMRELLAQRLYRLCCGWEDVSDHNVLRRDLALQTAAGRVDELASGPTLSRLETSATSERRRATDTRLWVGRHHAG